VSFSDWVTNGWLVAHKSSKQEIGNLLGIVARDLKDSQAKDVSERLAVRDRLQRGIAGRDGGPCGRWVSRVPRESSLPGHQSLELTLGKDAKFIRAFDAFRKKRNVSSYDIGAESPIAKSKR
jgi:hypothetical protein